MQLAPPSISTARRISIDGLNRHPEAGVKLQSIIDQTAGTRLADAEPREALVRFDNVQKSYDGHISVVASLNLSVAKGEFLTLLGPSGSGKTTCLMMLAGFEAATGGEIYLDGKPINNLPSHKRGIGMVFQNYALFPHMTVAENLAFPLKVRRMTRAEIRSRIEAALSMVQLSGFGNRRPHQLSGGQQQRVAVARALIFDPVLILMDEPLGALDKQLREQMQYEIKGLQKRLGITVIYVTHDQMEALSMSDRIAVFHQGKIQQIATPDILYESPQSAFVARFIGENNTLGGIVRTISEGCCQVEMPDGGILHALPVMVAGTDCRTTLSIRPERVNIRPPKDRFANVVVASVQELTYLGDHTRVRLSLCGVEDFIVKLPNGISDRSLKVGDDIELGWRVEDCHALDC
jgi:putative spermidine/putrescine transport system ATP-binding protein